MNLSQLPKLTKHRKITKYHSAKNLKRNFQLRASKIRMENNLSAKNQKRLHQLAAKKHQVLEILRIISPVNIQRSTKIRKMKRLRIRKHLKHQKATKNQNIIKK